MKYIAVDLETTGFSAQHNEIIEIGVAIYEDGEIIFEEGECFKPLMPISKKITELTGITNADVKNCKYFSERANYYKNLIADLPIVAHNGIFDMRFLKEKCAYNFPNELIDTMKLARTNLNLENNKLETVAAHYNIVNENAHRALDDAKCCAAIYNKMLETYNEYSKR